MEDVATPTVFPIPHEWLIQRAGLDRIRPRSRLCFLSCAELSALEGALGRLIRGLDPGPQPSEGKRSRAQSVANDVANSG
jgi:hypothetical protein